jgi:hypothetical protein
MVMNAMKEPGVTTSRHVKVNRRQSSICLDLNPINSLASFASFFHPLSPRPANLMPLYSHEIAIITEANAKCTLALGPFILMGSMDYAQDRAYRYPSTLFLHFTALFFVIITIIIPKRSLHTSICSDIYITAFRYQFALNYPSMVSAVVVAGGASRFNEATTYGRFKGLSNADAAAW